MNTKLLLKDETLRKKMIQKMQRLALERFSWERIINKYNNIL